MSYQYDVCFRDPGANHQDSVGRFPVVKKASRIHQSRKDEADNNQDLEIHDRIECTNAVSFGESGLQQQKKSRVALTVVTHDIR